MLANDVDVDGVGVWLESVQGLQQIGDIGEGNTIVSVAGPAVRTVPPAAIHSDSCAFTRAASTSLSETAWPTLL